MKGDRYRLLFDHKPSYRTKKGKEIILQKHKDIVTEEAEYDNILIVSSKKGELFAIPKSKLSKI